MGSLLGVDATAGGWVVGGIFTMAFIVIGMILSSRLDSRSSFATMFLVGFGLAFSTAVGWFPVWMFFGVFVIGLVSVMGLLSGRESAG